MQLDQFLKNRLGAYKLCDKPGCGCDSWLGMVTVSRFVPGTGIEMIRHYYNDSKLTIPWAKLHSLHHLGGPQPQGSPVEISRIAMYGGEEVIHGVIVETTAHGILAYTDAYLDSAGYRYFPLHRLTRIGDVRLQTTEYSPPTQTSPWPKKS